MEFRAALLHRGFSFLLPVICFFSLLNSIVTAVKSYQFLTQGLKIEGEVISLSNGKQPIMKFLPSSKAQLIEFRTSGIVDYKVGDRLTILSYKDISPYFMVDTAGSLFFEPLLTGAVGIGIIAVVIKLRRLERT